MPAQNETEELSFDGAPPINLEELKELFAAHLQRPENLRQPVGLPTGLQILDDFLFWHGLPKGALTLLYGKLGSGPTSLWLETATQVLEQNRWSAWINGEAALCPLTLKNKKANLGRLISIAPPDDEKKLLWLLQELMSSDLFDLIGCDLGNKRLKEHQIRKLQAQARQSHVALVFLSSDIRGIQGSMASVFSLILRFESRRILVERALHRPTPTIFPRSLNYARFTLHTRDRLGLGANTAKKLAAEPERPYSESSSLPQVAGKP